MNQNNTNGQPGNGSKFWTAAAGVAALGAGIYWLTSRRSEPQSSSQSAARPPQTDNAAPQARRSENPESMSQYLASFLDRMSTPQQEENNFISGSNVPSNPVITNLESLLADIFVRYIQLKNDDFELHYKVFDTIFQHLHKKMKEVDLYYNRYSSTVQFAGSHYDNLQIKKPDEFDMDIVIGLPLNIKQNPAKPNESDIIIEPKHAGFVQLRMGVQFQKLPMRDGINWQVNKAAYEWKDESNFLLQNKFLDWFKSVVNRALNTFELRGGVVLYYVEGVPYVIEKSSSGPAMTLIIKNQSRGFRLDVDLVPALKFPENRWPIGKGYRHIPEGCKRGTWMVVGKPNKAAQNHLDEKRSWRIALHNQERELMHNTYNLRQALRLIKKLRDAQGLNKIASYYIKTLFFWEIVERNDNLFWRNSPAELFKIMVRKLHAALVDEKIPYFWNKNNNLIWNVNSSLLQNYAAKLVPLIALLEHNGRSESYRHVAKFLLTPQEFREYNAMFLHI